MSESKILCINIHDLPILIELEGENEMREVYTLVPAGRKFGASLQKANGPIKHLLPQEAGTSFPGQAR